MNKVIDYVAMGKRIRRARKIKGFTQEHLAEICFLSAAHMGHIERGTRLPSLEAVFRVSKALGISMDYLMNTSLNTDDDLIQNIDDLIRREEKPELKTLISMIREIANKMDEA
jgi:transcriptional regulator with XRE-family HTH domain